MGFGGACAKFDGSQPTAWRAMCEINCEYVSSKRASVRPTWCVKGGGRQFRKGLDLGIGPNWPTEGANNFIMNSQAIQSHNYALFGVTRCNEHSCRFTRDI